MSESDSDELDTDVKRNINGGYYEPGKQYDMSTKVRVAELYRLRRRIDGGNRPNISQLFLLL